jgi:hypothetical protein
MREPLNPSSFQGARATAHDAKTRAEPTANISFIIFHPPAMNDKVRPWGGVKRKSAFPQFFLDSPLAGDSSLKDDGGKK